jgi:hypothetical protein
VSLRKLCAQIGIVARHDDGSQWRGDVSLDAPDNIAAVLARHSQHQEGHAMECTHNEGKRLAAEFATRIAARPVKATDDLATIARTRRSDDVVSPSTGMVIEGLRIAFAGDLVRYQNETDTPLASID